MAEESSGPVAIVNGWEIWQGGGIPPDCAGMAPVENVRWIRRPGGPWFRSRRLPMRDLQAFLNDFDPWE